MSRDRVHAVGAFLVICTLLRGPASASIDPVPRCQGKKTQAVAKMVRALLGCHVAAARAGTAVDPSCVTRLRATAARLFGRAEAASACRTVGDASMLADDTVRAVNLMRFFDLGLPPGPSRCTAARLAAVRRFAFDDLTAYARVERAGNPYGDIDLTIPYVRVDAAISASFALDDCLDADRPYEATTAIAQFASITVFGRLWPRCNDDVRAITEECDLNDSPACPFRCNPDCTCPHCGDGHVNVAGEQCDGADSAACPGLCRSDCACPLPVCGNGILESGETCDGPNAAACPGLCQADCTCPPPVCGNGILEAGEQCDGTLIGPTCPPFLGLGCRNCLCCVADGAECAGIGPCCEGTCYLLGAASSVCSSQCLPSGSPCSPTIPCCSGAACDVNPCP